MRRAPSESGKSSRASRTIERLSRQGTGPRRSKSSSSNKGIDDIPLEDMRNKWRDICDEDGIIEPPPIIRLQPYMKQVQKLEPVKQVCIKAIFQDDDNPNELQVEGEFIEREVFRSFCILFTSYSTITILRLIDCKLRPEGIAVLGNHMTDTNLVKELYLDLNPVSGEDYSPLFNNTSLEILSLKGCAISGQGAKLIGECLLNNNLPLRVLDLNTNLIDSPAVISLAKGLKWNNKISCLCLAGNYIGSEGAIYLASILKTFELDEDDLEKRQTNLLIRAEQILKIVNERKDEFLSTISPMHAMPPTEFPINKKTTKKVGGETIKLSKKTEERQMSKSQRLLTSSSRLTNQGDKKKSVGQKTGTSKKSQTPLKNKSTVSSLKQVSDATLCTHYEESNGPMDMSDEDSIADFSRFSDEIKDDWDKKDNDRRYKDKKLNNLCQEVASEVESDLKVRDPIMYRVYVNQTSGELCSRGNMALSHLYLSYNRIDENAFEAFMEVILYQEMRRTEIIKQNGLKQLFLEGNPMPSHLLDEIRHYFKRQWSSADRFRDDNVSYYSVR